MSRAFRFAPLTVAILCALVLCLPIADAASASRTRRVLVPTGGDAARAQAVATARGGRVVAIYETFALIEIPEGGGTRRGRGEREVGSRLHLRDFAFDAEPGVPHAPEVPARWLRGRYGERESGLHLVRFHGPVQDAWIDALTARGVRVISYVPDHALLVAMTPLTRRALERDDARTRIPIAWIGLYEPAYRLAPALHDGASDADVDITLVDDEPGRALARTIAREARVLVPAESHAGLITLVAHASAEAIARYAFEPSLVRIDPWSPPQLQDEVAALDNAGAGVDGSTPGFGLLGTPYLAWLEERGFDVDEPWDVIVHVVDTGLDRGMDDGTWHPDLLAPGGDARAVFVRDWTPDDGTAREGQDGDSHGTACAGIVAGYNDDSGFNTGTVSPSGYRFGIGIAPLARFGASKIFDFTGDPHSFSPTSLESYAHAQGARISSNSWGSSATSYGSTARAYDRLVRDARSDLAGDQPMILVFAAGNGGPGTSTVIEPGNAKNVITVGAAENDWPGYSTCGYGVAMQDTPGDDIASYSSRGPTQDGRRKPDVVAIAHGWIAPLSRAAASAGCTAFSSADRTRYRAFNGTSAATPTVAGTVALLYEHLVRTTGAPPSPALVKAALAATARDIAGGIDANRTNGTGPAIASAPNGSQGFGLVDAGRLLDDTPETTLDQSVVFSNSGQSHTLALTIADSGEPVTIALAFTDAPGTSLSAAWVNDLDLEVDHDGTLYLGNAFENGVSIPDGEPDPRNTLELVRLPAGVTGRVTVTVRAVTIAGDGVPSVGDTTDQDFALVAYNAVSCLPPAAPASVSAEPAGANRIRVSFAPSIDAVDSYQVLRAIGESGAFAEIAEVPGSATFFDDESASGGVLYRYRVRAVRTCASADSSIASATTTGRCVEPPLFAGLASATDTEGAACAIDLAWPAAVPLCGDDVWYDVFRSTDPAFTPSPATRIAQGVRGSDYRDDAALDGASPVFYRVQAVDAEHGYPDTNPSVVEARPSSGISLLTGAAPFPIPDGDLDGTTSTALAIDDDIVQSVRLAIDARHECLGDLLLRLTAPNGATVTMIDHPAGCATELVATFDRTRAPSGPGTMSDFAGSPIAGTWTLFAQDDLDWYSGDVDLWSLEIRHACTETPASPAEASPTGGTRVVRTAGGALRIRFDPAAFASEHALYIGETTETGGALAWTRALCAIGVAGEVITDVGELAPGTLAYFVPVGRTATEEGSYGRDHAGGERATSPLCPLPLALAAAAPAPSATAPVPAAERDATPPSAIALSLARTRPRLARAAFSARESAHAEHLGDPRLRLELALHPDERDECP